MRFLKNNLKLIIGFIVGVILASGITVYAVMSANEVMYKDDKSVAYALNDLYEKYNSSYNMELLWTNSNPTSSYTGGTINLDLTDYKYVVIDANSRVDNRMYGTMIKNFILVGETKWIFSKDIDNVNYARMRKCSTSNSGVTFENVGFDYDSSSSNYVVPYHIWGIK